MHPRSRMLARGLAQGLFSLLCLGTAAYAFAYLYMQFRAGDPFAESFAASGLDVPLHFFGAGTALLLVPLQLSTTVRRRWPRLHRIGGLLSVSAILVGGLSGLSLAQDAQGGWPSRAAFSVLSLLWIGATAQGLRLAVRGDLAGHRRWMACSMAMTAAAVTLRLMLGIGVGLLHLPFMTVYVTASWASWLLNLALCAWLLRASPQRRLSVAGPRSPSLRPHAGAGRRWGSRPESA